MKKLHKLSATAIALALCLLLTVTAWAANSLGVTYTAALDDNTLCFSDQEQTVTLTVATNKTVDMDAYTAQVKVPEGLEIKAIANETLNFNEEFNYNLENGSIMWYSVSGDNVKTDLLAVITITVPANTPVGEYQIDFVIVDISKDYSKDVWESGTTVSATLTISEHADGNDNNHDCDNCGKENVDGGHHGGTATCMAAAVCAECGEPYGNKNPDNHTGNNTTVGYEDSTCVKEGYTGNTVCECGATIATGTAIAKKDHIFTTYVAHSNRDGYETAKCDNCDATDTRLKSGYLAGGQCGDALYWELTEDGTMTISGTGEMWHFGEEPKPWSEQQWKIKKLIIEEGATSIGTDAFRDCGSLSTVSFPTTLKTIGYYAFDGCNLRNVVIPEGVTAIEAGAFYGSTNMGTLSLPSTLETIGNNAFTDLYLSEGLVIPAGVTSIGKQAFAGYDNWSGDETITFLGNAPTIGDDAFGYVTATCYYPVKNATWTEAVMLNYGGTLTWVVNCQHTFGYSDNGDGTHDYVCPTCGTVQTDNEEHTYVDGECVCGAVEPVATGLKGDVDLDGDVDSDDLTLLARHVYNVEKITDATALRNADVNENGVIDSDDVTKHARYVYHVITDWGQE